MVAAILPYFVIQNLPVLLLKKSRSREAWGLAKSFKNGGRARPRIWFLSNTFCHPLFPRHCCLKALNSDLLTQSYTCNVSSPVLTAPDLWCCESKGQNQGISSWPTFPTEQSCSSVCVAGRGVWKVKGRCEGEGALRCERGSGQKPGQAKPGETSRNLSLHMFFFSWGFSDNLTF